MGKSNHSKKGEGKNSWYKRRNRNRNRLGWGGCGKGRTRADRDREYLEKKEEQEESRKASIPASLPTKDHGPVHPNALTNWFGKVKSAIAGRFR